MLFQGQHLTTNNLNDVSTSPLLNAAEDSASTALKVSGRYKASIIAKNIDLSMEDFNRYNPGFDNMLATGAS